jgi:hypothetical protein
MLYADEFRGLRASERCLDQTLSSQRQGLARGWWALMRLVERTASPPEMSRRPGYQPAADAEHEPWFPSSTTLSLGSATESRSSTIQKNQPRSLERSSIVSVGPQDNDNFSYSASDSMPDAQPTKRTPLSGVSIAATWKEDMEKQCRQLSEPAAEVVSPCRGLVALGSGPYGSKK